MPAPDPSRRPLPIPPGRGAGRRHASKLACLAVVLAACAGAFLPAAQAQFGVPRATPTPTPQNGFFLSRQPQRPPAQTVPRQEGPKTSARLSETAPENAYVIISLSKQRAYLMYGTDTVIDSPISSGKRGHSTPTGHFHILVKEPNHYSNIYGNFVDHNGRVVRSGVSSVIDSAPSGTRFEGAPMKWFMRLTDSGVGMHVGILPGYAASHGCIRLPSDIAPLIYQRVHVGTAVTVEE